MTSFLARLLPSYRQSEYTCKALRKLSPIPKLAADSHGTPVHVHAWDFKVTDHMRFGYVNEDCELNNRCEMCNEPVLALTQVENRAGKTSLETGYCAACDFVQHTKRPSFAWVANHFKEGWLKERALPERIEPSQFVYKEVVDVLPKKARILDLGCGAGDKLLAFHHKGHDCWGVEPSVREVELARRGLGDRIARATAEEYLAQEPAELFDLAYFCGVLSFIQHPFAVVRRALDFIKPGGYLYVDVPRYNSGQWNLFFNAHLFIRPSIFSVRVFQLFARQHALQMRIGRLAPLGILLRKGAAVPGQGLTPATDLSLPKLYAAIDEQLHFRDLHKGKVLQLHYRRLGMSATISLACPTGPRTEVAEHFPVRFIHDTAAPPILLK